MKFKAMVFQVNFEKAFDFIRWDYLQDILKMFGFGYKWCGWINGCLNSAMGSVLVNGSPTSKFQFHKGLFSGIPIDSSLTLSHLFFADDAIFVGKWDSLNIHIIVNVLKCFHLASGLKINFHKSKLMGIETRPEEVKAAATTMGCSIFTTLFVHLGVKVGGAMSRIKSWDDVVWSLEATCEFSVKFVCQLIDDSILPKEEVATRNQLLFGATNPRKELLFDDLYGALFQRNEGLPVSSPTQATTSSSTVGFPLSTTNDENQTTTRPLPYDSDHRFPRLQRGLVSRREKSVTHFLDDSQSVSELTNRRSGVDLSVQDSKIGNLESLDKSLKVNALEGLLYEQTSDNEDVCPTCLEEYTLENPKIVTKCSHHFHLGCIYEWMERSDTCPMCGKMMEFCESP
ncbi:RNA-directed DNA polymerase, eukaryota [Tanacetum coccineum]